MKKITNITNALNLFEEAAVKQGKATETGDYKIGNKSSDQIIEIVSYLRKNNSILELKKFFSSPNVSVRLWAASFLLSLDEKESLNILESITNREDIYSLIAETTISEWRKGNLKL